MLCLYIVLLPSNLKNVCILSGEIIHPRYPFISLHFGIGETFIGFPHKSLNNNVNIIIYSFWIDLSRDKIYFCIKSRCKRNTTNKQ